MLTNSNVESLDGSRTQSGSKPLISVVVPIYNEERVIDLFMTRMLKVFDDNRQKCAFELIFSLDPSKDRTESILRHYCLADPRVKYIKFSRRIGQPLATMAGIDHCNGDACVIIDVDLQDPPELIPVLIEKWQEGFDVVLPQRRTRKGETLLKTIVSAMGYYVINKIASVNIPKGIGDFRLISRRVVDELRKIKEHHGFLRGLVSFVGFEQTTILYDRDARLSGQSKYNRFVGSLRIGLNGLVCFSSFLLSVSSIIGFGIALVSFIGLILIIICKLIFHQVFPTGTFLVISLILFIGGIQLISMGILGEYIGRIYEEVKQRPRYLIDKKVNFEPVPIEEPK